MKKLVLLLLTVSLFSCSGDDATDDLNSIMVSAYIEYEDNEFLVSEEFPVYYFEGVNLLDGYDLGPNGTLIDEDTGSSIRYTRKLTTTNGIALFEDLPEATHTVLVDMTGTFREDSQVNKMKASAINLSNALNEDGGEIKFTFDIWPWDPSSIYQ